MRRTWIIACGTELTLGQVSDTNSAWLASRLAACGYRPSRLLVVPDELAMLSDLLREAAARADVVVISGGLGPTEDDLMRSALADVAGVPLVECPESLERLRAFFAERGRALPERNRVQAEMPQGARALPNDRGTAPGICMQVRGTRFFALPGVPFEMRAMFEQHVQPVLAGGGDVVQSRRLHCFGLPESELGAKLTDLMQPNRNPIVGTNASAGVIDVCINAQGADAADAVALLDSTEEIVQARLGRFVFGRDADTLASAAGAALRQRSATLATAESCTGGLIGKLLTDTPGSSDYFVGGVVAYSNEMKSAFLDVPDALLARCGAVSGEVAEAMAAGARRRFSADLAVSVTGVAGPGGGTAEKPVGLVFIGLSGPWQTASERFLFGATTPRELIRLRSAWQALDWVRRAAGEP